MTPPSQKYRRISFRLTGGGAPVTFAFGIRPEELTVEEPVRATVTQTLGGAWLDEWGRGIATINLSGHNGWRGGLFLSGEDMLLALRDTVLQQWTDRRKALVDAQQDPSAVQLYFTDSLDSISAVVAPMRFSLRRSRTQPLLIMYQIQLTVLADVSDGGAILDQIISAISNPLRWIEGYLGLTAAVDALAYYESAAVAAMSLVGAAVNAVSVIPAAIGAFLSTGQALLSSVSNVASNAAGQFAGALSGLLGLGISFARAGANAFCVLADDVTLLADQRIALMGVAAAFNDAACCMANSFNSFLDYADYSGLLGASGCSSTGGGDPASTYTLGQINPFNDVFAAVAAPALVTLDAVNALASLQGDPLAMVGQPAIVAGYLGAAAAGVTVP